MNFSNDFDTQRDFDQIFVTKKWSVGTFLSKVCQILSTMNNISVAHVRQTDLILRKKNQQKFQKYCA